MLRWPGRDEVDAAVRAWAAREGAARPEVRRIAYVGSYARGDFGPGSDVDLVVVQDTCAEPFERRTLSWDVTSLLVPADLLVYTASEIDDMRSEGRRFARVLDEEGICVYERPA